MFGFGQLIDILKKNPKKRMCYSQTNRVKVDNQLKNQTSG